LRHQLTIPAADIIPSPEAILAAMGRDNMDVVDPRIQEMATTSAALLGDAIAAKAVIANISSTDFADLYAGAGLNENETPLASIYPHAKQLALFAVTIGPAVTEEVERTIASGDLALGAILDAGASGAAELGADYLARYYQAHFINQESSPAMAVMRYSPGYCGWHVTGQFKLFAYLRPEDAGITLRESALMEPMKSISGVMVAGEKSIHDFTPDYEFCAQCKGRSCRERQNGLSCR